MITSQNSYDAEVTYELKEAGLPTDMKQIIGRPYRFGCEFGSHHQILMGTVTAIRISDEGGIDLYVSNPVFRGGSVISINYDGSEWSVSVDTGELRKTFEGEFKLL
jgi:hypothetical protein